MRDRWCTAATGSAVGYPLQAEMAAVSTSTFLLLPSIAYTTHSAVFLAAHNSAVVGIIPYKKMDKNVRDNFTG